MGWPRGSGDTWTPSLSPHRHPDSPDECGLMSTHYCCAPAGSPRSVLTHVELRWAAAVLKNLSVMHLHSAAAQHRHNETLHWKCSLRLNAVDVDLIKTARVALCF